MPVSAAISVDAMDGSSYIAMDAPPPQEDVRPFIHVASVLSQSGVSVPQVWAQDRTILLLSDLGSTTYLQQLSLDTAHKLYMDAIDALLQFQMHSQPGVLPEYDRAMLLRELTLFPDWYIGQHLNSTLNDTQAADLKKVFGFLPTTWRSPKSMCTVITIRAT